MMDNILDTDGENKALRCFLLHYQSHKVSIGSMKYALKRSGFDGAWPEFVESRADDSDHLTKAGAQLWIRHLLSLEETQLRASSSEPAMDRVAKATVPGHTLEWVAPTWGNNLPDGEHYLYTNPTPKAVRELVSKVDALLVWDDGNLPGDLLAELQAALAEVRAEQAKGE